MKLTENSNLSGLFSTRVEETPTAPAYREFQDGAWREWTWAEVASSVGRWQAAFLREGLKPGDRVAICLRNCVEWVLFDQAALGLELVVVPLYFDDRPENMAWCLNNSGARLLLVDDIQRWMSISDLSKGINRIVCLTGNVAGEDKARHLTSWLGPEASPVKRSKAAASDLATIVYTSGTSGRPRGVMLSHRNILSNVSASIVGVPADTSDRFLSFLPLSHIFERTCGYYSAMMVGALTVYARSISLLGEDLRDQKPTIVMAVPRVFERIWGVMQEAMSHRTLKRRLFDKAVDVGWRHFRGESIFGDRIWWSILKPLVADKLFRRFGGQIRAVCVGGAAFPHHLARVFVGLGLPILNGYGLTECSPVVCTNPLGDSDPFSVGRSLPGVEVRLAENGELLVRGPNVMLGYWQDSQATAAAIDQDGWFHTGDIATLKDGRFYITGRLKEMIVLSNGEKVVPSDAEQAILRDPVFEQVMLIGEGRSKLGLLCVTKRSNHQELCVRANLQLAAFPGYVKIRHVATVSGPWTIENGLLTPTMKLKRDEIMRHYAKEIKQMFASDIPSSNG